MDFDGLHAELTDQVIGIAFQVANGLGGGFLESVYKKSMLLLLRRAGLTAREEQPIPVYFAGAQVGDFTADIVIENKLIIELKTGDVILKAHESQLRNYLRATDMEVGLLLCFGERVQVKRAILTNDRKQPTLPPS